MIRIVLCWVVAVVGVLAVCAPGGAWAYGSVDKVQTTSYCYGGTSGSNCKSAEAFLAERHTGTQSYPIGGGNMQTITEAPVGCSEAVISPGVARATCQWQVTNCAMGSCSSSTGSEQYTGSVITGEFCPSDSAESSPGAGCICMEGFHPVGGECASTDCPAKGTAANILSGGQVEVASDSLRFCHNGCGMTGSFGAGFNGKWFAVEPFRSDGTTCEDGTQGDPNTPGNPVRDGETGDFNNCAKGTCPGTFNGASMCVACNVSDPPKTTTETTPDGTTTTTETTTCDGSDCVTTVVTETCDDEDVCTTTTTTEDDTQMGFCEENPTFASCREGKWSGACQGGFSCDGDPIQCAIARDQHIRHCQMETHTDQSQAGVAMIDGNPHPSGHPYNDAEVQEVSFAGSIDQSNPLGGSCPSDRSFQVMAGSSITIPFSQLCTPLQMVGQVGVALAMLMAVFIAFKQ